MLWSMLHSTEHPHASFTNSKDTQQQTKHLNACIADNNKGWRAESRNGRRVKGGE